MLCDNIGHRALIFYILQNMIVLLIQLLHVLFYYDLVTVLEEHKYSNFKLNSLKLYMQSIMSNESFHGLIKIEIDNNLLESIDYTSLINNYVSTNVWRTTVKKMKNENFC